MKSWLNTALKTRKGVTLVELVVTFALLLLFLASLTALLSPAMRIFRRTQELNHAQIVAGTLLDTLRGEILGARNYVRVYDEGATFAETTDIEGASIEFVNGDGFVQLISTEGCEETDLYMRGKLTVIKTMPPVEPNRLLMRYYTLISTEIGTPTYHYKDQTTGRHIARELTSVYGKGFYVGSTIKLKFTLNPSAQAKPTVASVGVAVSILNKDGEEVFTQTQTFDMPHVPLLQTNGATATARPTEAH